MILIDDRFAYMLSNKEFNPIVPELFIRSRRLNISLVFIVLFCCTKKYWNKFYTLLFYENSKEMRASTALIIHQILALENSKNNIIFSD